MSSGKNTKNIVVVDVSEKIDKVSNSYGRIGRNMELYKFECERDKNLLNSIKKSRKVKKLT